MTNGPVLIDLEDEDASAALAVQEAAPVPDAMPPAPPVVAPVRVSRLAGWFWGLASALVVALLSVAAWRMVESVVMSSPLLGWGLAGLAAVFALVALLVMAREGLAIGRLRRLGTLREDVTEAEGLDATRRALDRVAGLYSGRRELDWGRARWAERRGDEVEPETLRKLAEDCLMGPLDKAALAEVERSARRVATVTALVPLGLVDVVMAGGTSLRMIRRIGEIYGGRGGVLGSLRLTRAVVVHLAATGAMAVGDELLEPVLGGTVLAKLSRRFGEGMINGALTVRVGLAAMDLCRPVSFSDTYRPRSRVVIARALAGIFSEAKS